MSALGLAFGLGLTLNSSGGAAVIEAFVLRNAEGDEVLNADGGYIYYL
jgi:hypothetical protein